MIRRVADGLKAVTREPASLKDLRASMDKIHATITRKSGPITPTMTDTPTVHGQYKTRMNQYVAPGISVGLDGGSYTVAKKSMFKSKITPMTDGTELLVGVAKKPMSSIGYGTVPTTHKQTAADIMRTGFNNTLTDVMNGGLRVSRASPLDMKGIMAHPNNPVCSDFPKGPGGVQPGPLWRDGNYADMIAEVHKQQDNYAPVSFLAPRNPRREVFDAQALVGGQVYGNALSKQFIEDDFATMREEELRGTLRLTNPSSTEEDIDSLVAQLRIERRAARIGQQLRLPPGSAIARQAAEAEIGAEEVASETRREIQEQLAQEAAERQESIQEQRSSGVRNRIGRLLSRVRLPDVRGRLVASAGELRGALVARNRPDEPYIPEGGFGALFGAGEDLGALLNPGVGVAAAAAAAGGPPDLAGLLVGGGGGHKGGAGLIAISRGPGKPPRYLTQEQKFKKNEADKLRQQARREAERAGRAYGGAGGGARADE
jgi:hypothetical protein